MEFLLVREGGEKREFHGLTRENLHLLHILGWKYFTGFHYSYISIHAIKIDQI